MRILKILTAKEACESLFAASERENAGGEP